MLFEVNLARVIHGGFSSNSLGVRACDEPFEMLDCEDHDNADSGINMGLGEEPVKRRGRRSIPKIPLKTEIVIHEFLISQLNRELACGKQKEIEF